MDTEQQPAPKKKMGRPPKDKHGVNMWIPAELLDAVKLMIQTNRQAKQQKRSQPWPR